MSSLNALTSFVEPLAAAGVAIFLGLGELETVVCSTRVLLDFFRSIVMCLNPCLVNAGTLLWNILWDICEVDEVRGLVVVTLRDLRIIMATWRNMWAKSKLPPKSNLILHSFVDNVLDNFSNIQTFTGTYWYLEWDNGELIKLWHTVPCCHFYSVLIGT